MEYYLSTFFPVKAKTFVTYNFRSSSWQKTSKIKTFERLLLEKIFILGLKVQNSFTLFA